MNIELNQIPFPPNCSARCPTCNEVVACHQIEYIRMHGIHNTKLYHKECETLWCLDILNDMHVTILETKDSE